MKCQSLFLLGKIRKKHVSKCRLLYLPSILSVMSGADYHFNLNYWDAVTIYRTCLKPERVLLQPVDVSKICWTEWQTV